MSDATTHPPNSTSTSKEPRPFELLGGLPRGTTVLEASAGTGKTYAIAGLVARYVVEDEIPLQEILVVTFTKPATAELRDRVRRRLVDCANHLERVLAGAPPEHPDTLTAHLATSADGDREELQLRHNRATAAITDFDAATISTIHSFCQHILRTLGLTVDVDRDAALLADQSELVRAVVDDLLVRACVDHEILDLTRSTLLEIAYKVVGNPDARIVPTDAEGPAGLRAELAARVRAVLGDRKRERRLLSYDDLLTQLRAALADPEQGAIAVKALRERYKVALIDEFQDTDPVQWEILAKAFGVEGSSLILIGDPKQAIYSFRGADVHAYLDAVRRAGDRRTLSTNWRSDGPLLTAFDTLLRGATFGDPAIRYRTVSPADGHDGRRLVGAPRPQPLRLRCVLRSHGLRASKGNIQTGIAREHVADDVAVQTVELLQSGARILDRAGDPPERGRPLVAGDIAVLVRTNAEAVLVHRALRDAGVPAIINGVGSVFDTPAATEWLQLLEALERPSNPGRARAVALTSFVGWTGDQLANASDDKLANASDDKLATLHDDLHEWARILRDRGVASLVRTITVREGLPERLLAIAGGERHLTDLEHLSQLLHRAAVEDELGPAALTTWLAQMIAETDDEQVPPEERARRLESDALAVQILTVHRSKGLQYPIVFAPYLWAPGHINPGVITFHDDEGRAVDAGGSNHDGWEENKARFLDDHVGEQLRLLYVALTRAEHHVIAWWAPAWMPELSGLGKILFARDVHGELDTTLGAAVPSDDRCLERLSVIRDRSGGTMSLEPTDRDPQPGDYTAEDEVEGELAGAELGRSIDRVWYRTSYSRITSRMHADDAGPTLVGSEPAETVKEDEALLAPPGAAVAGDDEVAPGGGADADLEARLRAVELPLAEAGGGTVFGTFVHTVLEHIDFTSDDLPAEVARIVAEQSERHRSGVRDHEALLDGLVRAIRTPLGALAGDRRLAELPLSSRLNELDFELPLDPRLTGAATVTRIGELLLTHLPADDAVVGYGELLASGGFDEQLRGYLAGSIDLVLRAEVDGSTKFVVADHKTNRLGTWPEPLTAWDYRPAVLVDAMARGHYPLQSLLYQVALHRYLRWRLAGYEPDQHLGGALYLFLRGMIGPETPLVDGQPYGVFAWKPPASLIMATSDLLDGADALAGASTGGAA